ncbi:radical SAM protein [Sorangium sp. So ce269]
MHRSNLSKRGVSPLPMLQSQPTQDETDPQQALEKALVLAGVGEVPVRRVSQYRTRYRSLTRRGVMWLGQTCNVRCYFCYFLGRIEDKAHPEHEFMTLEKAKEICRTLAVDYKNNAIDIQGGEPTIWPGILELVSYCREIGLHPTLITNALALEKADKCEAFRAAGIRDFLISVHGIGEVHDRVVQFPGAHAKQMKALRNLRQLGIPYRFNCVLSKPVVPQLPQIAELAVKTGAHVINFLAFNPFEDQAAGGRRSAVNVPRYSEVSDKLNEALDILEANGVEANVRYYPLCMVDRSHTKSTYNFQQLPYDHHEWDYASWSWTHQQSQRMKAGPTSPLVPLTGQSSLYPHRKHLQRLAQVRGASAVATSLRTVAARTIDHLRDRDALYRANAQLRARELCGYVYDDACKRCSLRNICDGFHGDYASLFGSGEARPVVLGKTISDPRHFIAQQEKWVENEDLDWALPSASTGT